MDTVELRPWHNGLLKELLLEVPANGTWEEILARIEGKMEEAKNSAPGRNAQLTLHLGNRVVPPPDLEALAERLKSRYGLLAVAVVSPDTATQDAARRLGLNVYNMLPGSTTGETLDAGGGGNSALYVANTVRSGQRLLHPGSVLVAGDVNSGAEVIAEGDIIVFGTLRGLAHAGCRGDHKARILAGAMRPQQLRIADRIARSPEDAPAPADRRPEVARIEGGEIQVFPA